MPDSYIILYIPCCL